MEDSIIGKIDSKDIDNKEDQDKEFQFDLIIQKSESIKQEDISDKKDDLNFNINMVNSNQNVQIKQESSANNENNINNDNNNSKKSENNNNNVNQQNQAAMFDSFLQTLQKNDNPQINQSQQLVQNPSNFLNNFKSNKSQLDENFQLKNNISVNRISGKIERNIFGMDQLSNYTSRLKFEPSDYQNGAQNFNNLTSANNFNSALDFSLHNYRSNKDDFFLKKQDSFNFNLQMQQSNQIQNFPSNNNTNEINNFLDNQNLDIGNNNKNQNDSKNQMNLDNYISAPPNLFNQDARKNSMGDSLTQQFNKQKIEEDSTGFNSVQMHGAGMLNSMGVSQLAKDLSNNQFVQESMIISEKQENNNQIENNLQNIKSNYNLQNEPSNQSFFIQRSWFPENKTDQPNYHDQSQSEAQGQDDLIANETPLSRDKSSSQVNNNDNTSESQAKFNTQNNESSNSQIPLQKQKRKYNKKQGKLNNQSKKISKNNKNLNVIQEEEQEIQSKKIMKKIQRDIEDDDSGIGTYTRITTILKTEIKTRNKDPKKKYRQSRHKNVFKNFGSAIMRFLMFNSEFLHYKIDIFEKNIKKVESFNAWLKNHIKLERKTDFVQGWTWYQSDTDEVCEFKDALRMLCYEFFENYALNYLMNSKKLDDLEIHLRSIFPFIQGINDPDTLERFKPK